MLRRLAEACRGRANGHAGSESELRAHLELAPERTRVGEHRGHAHTSARDLGGLAPDHDATFGSPAHRLTGWRFDARLIEIWRPASILREDNRRKVQF